MLKCIRPIMISCVLFLSCIGYGQTTIELIPTKDNTIFEEDGNESMGKSGFIFAGKTGGPNNDKSRRALFHFDVSLLPSNAVITEVIFDLGIFKAPNDNSHPMTLHRLLNDWGEGESGIDVSRGEGEDAETNDATWTHRFYNTSDVWSQQGGDYISQASSVTQAEFTNGPTIPHAIWNSSGLVDDVQGWKDNSFSNYGWILIGDENTVKSAKKFVGKDNTSPFFPKPKLTITYTIPGQVVLKSPIINEVNLHDKWVEIYNGTDEAFDLSTWSLCEGTSCNTIGGMDAPVIHGDLMLDTSEYLIVRWDALDTMAGEMVLQSSVGAIDTSEMKDYLQYGSSNQPNATAAVIKELWNDANLFLNIPPDYKNTLSLTSDPDFTNGQMTSSSNWNTWGATASQKNEMSPSVMSLVDEVVGGSYIVSDELTISGHISANQTVELEALNGINLNNGMTVDSSAILQAVIPD